MPIASRLGRRGCARAGDPSTLASRTDEGRCHVLASVRQALLLRPDPGCGRTSACARRCSPRLPGTPTFEAGLATTLAGLHAMEGRFAEARELYADSVAVYDEFGPRLSRRCRPHASSARRSKSSQETWVQPSASSARATRCSRRWASAPRAPRSPPCSPTCCSTPGARRRGRALCGDRRVRPPPSPMSARRCSGGGRSRDVTARLAARPTAATRSRRTGGGRARGGDGLPRPAGDSHGRAGRALLGGGSGDDAAAEAADDALGLYQRKENIAALRPMSARGSGVPRDLEPLRLTDVVRSRASPHGGWEYGHCCVAGPGGASIAGRSTATEEPDLEAIAEVSQYDRSTKVLRRQSRAAAFALHRRTASTPEGSGSGRSPDPRRGHASPGWTRRLPGQAHQAAAASSRDPERMWMVRRS